jgi:hypothetical protein
VSGVAARGAVAVVAIVVLGWLAVMERDERLFQRGVDISGRIRGAADAGRAESAFLRARLLNPDTSPEMGRAVLYLGRGRRERAVAVIEDVLRREPDNLAAWGQLYRLTQDADAAATRRALAAQRRLDPLNALPRRSP